MATMTHRTTFALDSVTAKRIKSLSKRWKVSQAEVVRRAVSLAEAPLIPADPVEMLRKLHQSGGGLVSESAAAYLAEVREDRRQWRGQ